MGWRDLFRKPQLPERRRLREPALAIARPKAFTPLPTTGDPLDAAVVRLWIAYSQQATTPTGEGFLAELAEANADLTRTVARLNDDCAFYRKQTPVRL